MQYKIIVEFDIDIKNDKDLKLYNELLKYKKIDIKKDFVPEKIIFKRDDFIKFYDYYRQNIDNYLYEFFKIFNNNKSITHIKFN